MNWMWIKLGVVFVLFFAFGFAGIFYHTKQSSEKKAEVRKALAAKSAFSLENAPKESIRGDITSVSGEVKWQSRTATEAGTLIPNIKIQQGEMLETENTGSITLNFPSLGEIALRPKTQLSIIQSLPTSFTLVQTRGSAFYTSEKSAPISVRSLHLLANVTGSALISVDNENGYVTISVTDGDVTIAYNDTDNVSQVKLISKNETATYNDETRKVTVE